MATAWMPHLRGVSIGVWTAVGGRHETANECGVAHFLEHLFFKGTSAHTARELTQAIEGVGGYLNAYTTEDHTCYYAKADASHFERSAEVLLEMYLDAQFPEQELEREREVIREEILSVRDNPSQWAEDLLSESLWPRQPLGRPLTGTLESLQRLERRHMQAFRDRHYTGRNTIFTVAGPVPHEEVLQRVRAPLERLEVGRPSRALRARPGDAAFCAQEADTGQSHLALGFHACSRSDSRRFALRLLSVLLGENMSSRLFQTLRERFGYCYSMQSSIASFAETGALCIYADLEASKLAKAMAVIQRECLRFAHRAPSAKEVRLAAQYAVGQNRVSLDSATHQACWMAESLMAFGRVVEPTEVERDYFAVQKDEIQSVARDLIRFDKAALALVGGGMEAVALERAMGKSVRLLRL
ncbi:MAG: insulinase family protein [Verrucomicrobia bacterium]|nr:insulinase family protein [Verrucomicrobiota bacterium]